MSPMIYRLILRLTAPEEFEDKPADDETDVIRKNVTDHPNNERQTTMAPISVPRKPLKLIDRVSAINDSYSWIECKHDNLRCATGRLKSVDKCITHRLSTVM